MVPTRPPRSQLGLLARCQAPALAGAMHLPTPPHAGASTPGRGPDDLIVACWNVGMPDKLSFTKNLEKAMEDVRMAIADMVSWDVDIIGLNEVHPEFHSLYERTITSAFANMKFLGLPSGDAFVWRASCRLASFASGGGGSEIEWSGGARLRAPVLCVCVCGFRAVGKKGVRVRVWGVINKG